MKSRTLLSRQLTAFVILLLLAVAACGAQPQPNNIILIIGDGMGIGAITATRCAGPGENGKLLLDSMPVTGLVKTHSESLVTDSAASATALATGHKTKNGHLSLTTDGKTLPTFLEMAIAMGKSTGVVTTDLVTSATPAAFYAHVDDRSKQDSIALQLAASKMTVAMGSGKQYFIPKSSDGKDGRADGQDVVNQAKQNGYDVVFDKNALAASNSKRLLGLFTFDETGPTLENMLDKAVSVMSKNKKGFFIMAESCLPDKGGHANDAPTVVKGVLALEDALKYALGFAKKDGHTLVVVTADHETGGLAVIGRDEENTKSKPGWIYGGHTGNMVAVYAFGPGAEKFMGTHDNTEIPKIFSSLWGKTLGK